MDLEAMKAAFLAKGGKVQTIAEGETNGMTPRDWRKAVQNPGYMHIKTDADAYAQIERDAENYMQRVRDAAHMGGRAGALDALNRA